LAKQSAVHEFAIPPKRYACYEEGRLITYKTMKKRRLELLRGIRRVVVKIGSGVLGDEDGGNIAEATLHRLVDEICAVEKDGRFQVVLVSSGAVMAGARSLDLRQENLPIPMKQASAAIGQVKLMKLFARSFARCSKKVGQILLTHDDISNRRRFLNARNTLETLLGLGVLPIINENDSAAVHEIKFGDNDTLAAMITAVVDADLLLILSDVEGLFDSDPFKDPNAKLIEEVETINANIESIAGTGSSKTGIGGMKAKVTAARTAMAYGVPTWIISGKKEGSIHAALYDGEGGTVFHPHAQKVSQRKHWIAHILKSKGKVYVDDGAKSALISNGKSLLPSGITQVSGKFDNGEAVSIMDGNENEFARGLVNYNSFELGKIKGANSASIEEILGYKTYDEVIHRNDLVLLKKRD